MVKPIRRYVTFKTSKYMHREAFENKIASWYLENKTRKVLQNGWYRATLDANEKSKVKKQLLLPWLLSASNFTFNLCWFNLFHMLCISPFLNKSWFLRVCRKSLLKTEWEKDKLLVTSNFSFSHSVFYLLG